MFLKINTRSLWCVATRNSNPKGEIMFVIKSNEADVDDIDVYVDDNDGQKTVIARQGDDALFFTGKMAEAFASEMFVNREKLNDDTQ